VGGSLAQAACFGPRWVGGAFNVRFVARERPLLGDLYVAEGSKVRVRQTGANGQQLPFQVACQFPPKLPFARSIGELRFSHHRREARLLAYRVEEGSRFQLPQIRGAQTHRRLE